MKNLTLQIPDTTFAQYASASDAADKRDDDTRARDQLAQVINQWAVNRAQLRIMQTARAVAADIVGSELPVLEFIPDITPAAVDHDATDGEVVAL